MGKPPGLTLRDLLETVIKDLVSTAMLLCASQAGSAQAFLCDSAAKELDPDSAPADLGERRILALTPRQGAPPCWELCRAAPAQLLFPKKVCMRGRKLWRGSSLPLEHVPMGKQALLQPLRQMLLPKAASSSLQPGFQHVCSPCLIPSARHPAAPRLGDLQTTVLPGDQHLAALILVPGMWERCSSQPLCGVFFTRTVAEDFLEFYLLIQPSIWTCQQ